METGSEVGRGNLAQLYSGDASHETRLTLEAYQAALIRCDASHRIEMVARQNKDPNPLMQICVDHVLLGNRMAPNSSH
jgi:hypothetical protein